MKRFSSLLTSQSTLHCRSHSPQSCSDAVDVRCSLGNQPHSCDDEHKPSVRSNCQVLCPRTHPPVDWRDQESNPQPYNLWATQFTTKLPNFLLLFFFFFYFWPAGFQQYKICLLHRWCCDSALTTQRSQEGVHRQNQPWPLSMTLIWYIDFQFQFFETVTRWKRPSCGERTLKCRASLWVVIKIRS